jgi:hypothetical protein
LSFLWCELTITGKVTSNDKRDFGITPPVQSKQAEINTNKMLLANKKMMAFDEQSNEMV